MDIVSCQLLLSFEFTVPYYVFRNQQVCCTGMVIAMEKILREKLSKVGVSILVFLFYSAYSLIVYLLCLGFQYQSPENTIKDVMSALSTYRGLTFSVESFGKQQQFSSSVSIEF